jgi:hypothetical protein
MRVLIVKWCVYAVGFLTLAVILRLALSPSRTAVLFEKWQREGQVCLHGRVVDAEGQPLAGARVLLCVDSFRLLSFVYGGTSNTRRFEAVTREDGTFSVMQRHGTRVYIEEITYDGLRHLYARDAGTGNTTFSYASEYGYQCDAASPAIFPMIKPGEQPRLLPSKGGAFREGPRVTPNLPVVPRWPSVPFEAPP